MRNRRPTDKYGLEPSQKQVGMALAAGSVPEVHLKEPKQNEDSRRPAKEVV